MTIAGTIPLHEQSVRREPLVWREEFCGGAWLLGDYADVAAALRDQRFSVNRTGRWVNSSIDPGLTDSAKREEEKNKLRELKRILARSLLFIDGSSHTRLRRAMQAGFSASSLQRRSPKIAAITGSLIQNILARQTCNPVGQPIVTFDFIRDFARPLPAMVIADLMGIAPDAQAEFIVAAADIAAFIGSPTPTMEQAQSAQTAATQMFDYFRDVLEQPQHAIRDDLLTLLRHQKHQGAITATELMAQCCTLLFAGYETTRHLLGSGMLALLQHPTQWQALKDAPEQLPKALRELLRYNSPVQYTGRRLREDVVMHGCLLRKGQLVILDIAAANRDPHRFDNPNQLDIARDEGNHLSFGHGSHACIGAMLTYMEAEIAFRALMRALPRMQLASATPQWQANAAYRGLESLPLTCVLTQETSLSVTKQTLLTEVRRG
jgi:cytochrome P450